MSIFDWFSGNSSQASPSSNDEQARAGAGRKKGAFTQPQRLAPEPPHRSDSAKLRHTHRDQLFIGIREAMTRAGVLSGSYKFKVLSVDQMGHQFLVMMDMATVAGDPPPSLTEIEALIQQMAKLRFEITVTSVYWRLSEIAAASKFMPHPAVAAPPAAAMPAAPAPPAPPAAKPSASPYEPIHADEVAAFQQALMQASMNGPSVTKGVAVRTGLRTTARVTDFEDTEMTESAAAAPALSATQYGDLM